MYKVVFILKQLVIRLKECLVDVTIKDQQNQIPLATKAKIQNGFCNINSTTQFYVNPNNSHISIQVTLHLENVSKMGGEVKLTIQHWEANVLHNTISELHRSPDKQARLTFAFYYFPDTNVKDLRPMFLSNDRFKNEYDTIRLSSQNLTQQNQKLEKEVLDWNTKNQLLSGNKSSINQEMSYKDIEYNQKMFNYKNDIDSNFSQSELSKAKRQKLFNLAMQNGLFQGQTTQ